jgi:MFS family permease
MLMIVLAATIVNVALPTIQEDLGFSQSDLAWVVNAYLIAFGGLLLLAGRIGDLIGQRRIFLIGLATFPDDVAEAVLHFASERRSGKSTGNLLNVDGGVPAAYAR